MKVHQVDHDLLQTDGTLKTHKMYLIVEYYIKGLSTGMVSNLADSAFSHSIQLLSLSIPTYYIV